ncbi:MAG: multiheme c-type cytochrome [Cyclobacteriaceae bacterium]
MSPLRKSISIIHLVIAGHLMALVLLVSTCDLRKSENKLSGVVHFSGREFAGSETCVECHRSIADSHSQTPHFLTSRLADAESVKGSFEPGENIFQLDDRLRIVMEKDSTGLFQRGFVDGFEVDGKPMHIAIGSGRKGQSYLYWESNSLFQLPVSYYTPLDIWCNSPGYPTDQILFNRDITARCLECHSTYFKITKSAGGLETFDPDQAMLGIDCERCHGPAAGHVIFHRDNPEERKGKHIINPAQLSREQKLDNCALCHSGIRDNLLPSFSYVVGENLNDYFFPDRDADNASGGPTHQQAGLDVHGNQYGLLRASKCFRMSSMDCSSCHNEHAMETNALG